MNQKTKILESFNDKLSIIYDSETIKPERFWHIPDKTKEFIDSYIKPGCEVLELGIGTGRISEYLSKKGCKITGVDISQKMLDVAKSKNLNWKLFRADIQKGTSFLEGKKFDIIIAVGIFEFIEDMKKVLENINLLLNDSGKILFTYEEYLPDSQLQKWKISELGKGIIDPVPESLSFLVYRRTPEEVRKILECFQLRILKSERIDAYYKTPQKIPVKYEIILAGKS